MGLSHYSCMRQVEDIHHAERERRSAALARTYHALCIMIGEPSDGLIDLIRTHENRALYFTPTGGHA